ncbi:MAG: hypothetical protein LIP23_05500, partial [Planctomycetes bacterium]|nr:hypothetical protein [Planctomycetota bacterium]
ELRQRLKPQRDDAEIRDLAAARKMELATIQRIGRDLRRRIATTNAIPGGLRDRLDQCLLELEGVDGL